VKKAYLTPDNITIELATGATPKRKTTQADKKEKRRAEKTTRRFTITREYNGKRNLSDIFADLLYGEYCKREQQKKDGNNGE